MRPKNTKLVNRKHVRASVDCLGFEARATKSKFVDAFCMHSFTVVLVPLTPVYNKTSKNLTHFKKGK